MNLNKTLTVLILFVLLISGEVIAEGFQGMPWESTMEEVVNEFGTPQYTNAVVNNTIQLTDYVYYDTIANYPINKVFSFKGNLLVMGFLESKVHGEDLRAQKKVMSEILWDKYGDPDERIGFLRVKYYWYLEDLVVVYDDQVFWGTIYYFQPEFYEEQTAEPEVSEKDEDKI